MVNTTELLIVTSLGLAGLLALLIILWKWRNPHQSTLYLPGLPRILAPRIHERVRGLSKDELDSQFRRETGLIGSYSNAKKRQRLSRIYEQRDRDRLRNISTQSNSSGSGSNVVSRMGLPNLKHQEMEVSRVNITWKRQKAPQVFPKLLGGSLDAPSRSDRLKRIAESTVNQTIGSIQEVRKTEEYHRLLNVASTEAARGSSRIIMNEFNQSSRQDQIRMKRMVYLASKSAAVGSRSERFSPETHAKLADIAQIYGETHQKMKVRPTNDY